MKTKKQKKTALATTQGTPSESLAKDTRGLSTVEYLILLVIIAVAGIALWGKFADEVETQTTGATKQIKDMK